MSLASIVRPLPYHNQFYRTMIQSIYPSYAEHAVQVLIYQLWYFVRKLENLISKQSSLHFGVFDHPKRQLTEMSLELDFVFIESRKCFSSLTVLMPVIAN